METKTIPLSTHAFAGSDPFTIAGVPLATDAGVIEVGFDLNLTPDATVEVAYQGQFGDGVEQNGFNARFNVRF